MFFFFFQAVAQSTSKVQSSTSLIYNATINKRVVMFQKIKKGTIIWLSAQAPYIKDIILY